MDLLKRNKVIVAISGGVALLLVLALIIIVNYNNDNTILNSKKTSERITFDSYFSQMYESNPDSKADHKIDVERDTVTIDDNLRLQVIGDTIEKASKDSVKDNIHNIGSLTDNKKVVSIGYTDDITKVKELDKVYDIKTYSVNNSPFAGMMVKDVDGKLTPVVVVIANNSQAFIFDFPESTTETQLVGVLNKLILSNV